MNQTIKFTYIKPKRAGVFTEGEKIFFCFNAEEYLGANEVGVILYHENSVNKIPFSNEGRMGTLFGLMIEESNPKNITYNFYADSEIIHDPLGKTFTGNEKFGETVSPDIIRAKIYTDDFDWDNDKFPDISVSDSILYGLNVRGFTKDKSSGVKNKGTFAGVAEKIPYFLELGINGIVLMPAYEFDECELRGIFKSPKNMDEAKELAFIDKDSKNSLSNCWGFTKGIYFAPKTSYSSNNDAVYEFKSLIKELHSNGIEVIMQMYFPKGTAKNLIHDVLCFYVNDYHVDGFRINGFDLPYELIMEEPLLKNTKLWFTYIPENILGEYNCPPGMKKIMTDNGDFRNVFRRFLKSDEGVLNLFCLYNRANPFDYGVINYICDYDGFSLKDLYSYERKHNENNLENNSDGTDYNFSWNCGVEGDTKKKNIVSARTRQIKNALGLLMLCQGTPYIFSGDEFGNSRYGNNNAYCQDNIVWNVEWKKTVFSNEILDYTKMMISIRKSSNLFHMKNAFKCSDSLNIGIPDLSYHGSEPWQFDMTYNSRIIGMLFSGRYAEDSEKYSYYVGINMHWENKNLAIPKLKGCGRFEKIVDTGIGNSNNGSNIIPLTARSFVIYRCKEG